MKKRTINIFSILLVFLLLLVGCRDSGQEQPLGEWDLEAGILTVDGVRYRKDEALVSIGDGLHRWRYAYIFGDDPAKALPVCAEFMKLHQENPGEL